jgi:alkylated DNA nucleotide flippase Atl1
VKKTFNQKLTEVKNLPEIVIVDDPVQIARHGGDKMLVAEPLAYDRVMRTIPYGKVTTSEHIRKYLAVQSGADYTCHLTAGIFINIVAHASIERDTDQTPYWRTLKKGGELNPKFPGGTSDQKVLLEAEGHTITQKNNRFFVENFEAALFPLLVIQ